MRVSAVAVAALVLLAGCGGQSAPGQSTTTPNAPDQSTTTERTPDGSYTTTTVTETSAPTQLVVRNQWNESVTVTIRFAYPSNGSVFAERRVSLEPGAGFRPTPTLAGHDQFRFTVAVKNGTTLTRTAFHGDVWRVNVLNASTIDAYTVTYD